MSTLVPAPILPH